MKPRDAQPGDRRRYFDQGWMWDTKKDRPVFVRYSGQRFTIYDREGTPESATLSRLEPWYPEGKCINSYGVGICVMRRPKQIARRTASICHYEVAFCPPQKRLSVDNRIMWDLITTTTYPDFGGAVNMLTSGVPSVAISENLILHNDEDTIQVYWHDTNVGHLDDGLFVPDFESNCFAKLVRMDLLEVAPQCL